MDSIIALRDFFSHFEGLQIKILFLMLMYVAVLNRKNNNALMLIFVIMIMGLLDVMWLNNALLENDVQQGWWVFEASNIKGMIYYFSYFVFDFIVAGMIIYRAKLFKFFATIYLVVLNYTFNEVPPVKKVEIVYQRHLYEFHIVGVYLFISFLNLLALFEYWVRAFVSKEIVFFYLLVTPVITPLITLYEIYLIRKIGLHSSSSVFMKE